MYETYFHYFHGSAAGQNSYHNGQNPHGFEPECKCNIYWKIIYIQHSLQLVHFLNFYWMIVNLKFVMIMVRCSECCISWLSYSFSFTLKKLYIVIILSKARNMGNNNNLFREGNSVIELIYHEAFCLLCTIYTVYTCEESGLTLNKWF